MLILCHEVDVMLTTNFHHKLQHHLNSVHIYCKLCYIIPESTARKFSLVWEIFIHPLIYKEVILKVSHTQ
jgi:hypothetical protein